MRSSTRRQALLLLLIAVAGVAGVVLRTQDRPIPQLPTVDTLTAGSEWQQLQASSYEGPIGTAYRQWLLRDGAGNEAMLYVGATGRAQTMVRWSGELGYEGEGYSVAERGERTLPTGDGRSATVGTALLQRLSSRRLVEYAVVDPEGIVPRGTDSLARTGWDLVRGQGGPYYLVRASVVADAQGPATPRLTADRLLGAVLPRLRVQATPTRSVNPQ